MRLETFLVRIWTGPDASDVSGSPARQPGVPVPAPVNGPMLLGVARHVRTGAERRFTCAEDLLGFLAAEQAAPPAAPRHERAARAGTTER